jgi:hypothetical protein
MWIQGYYSCGGVGFKDIIVLEEVDSRILLLSNITY